MEISSISTVWDDERFHEMRRRVALGPISMRESIAYDRSIS